MNLLGNFDDDGVQTLSNSNNISFIYFIFSYTKGFKEFEVKLENKLSIVSLENLIPRRW